MIVGDGIIRLDFVHPSYHEAFWYAVTENFRWLNGGSLLSSKLENVLRDLANRVDLVQLKMIERYGTINRDLDQLLLLSAASEDPNEQLIALIICLAVRNRFASLPEFAACVSSIVSNRQVDIRIEFLDLYDKRFEQLPLDVWQMASLIFDR